MNHVFVRADQAAVIDFLSAPDSYCAKPHKVETVETHAALIFLAGADVYKIKKAVKLPYLDFSTLEQRRVACERELAINQPHAPQIYVDLVAIRALPNGDLTLGPIGDVVEWAVHMHRFADDRLMSAVAGRGELAPQLLDQLTDGILDWHAQAEVCSDRCGIGRVLEIVEELCAAFDDAPDIIDQTAAKRFRKSIGEAARLSAHRLNRRAQQGYVRRCHGDLHLSNIVCLEDGPVLFDALEFDERLATIDLLYDLAFLLMDLVSRGLTAEANRVLNRYVVHSNDAACISGLAALPLFLSCRAAITGDGCDYEISQQRWR